MKRSLFIALSLFLTQTLFSQDLRIYHGETSESVFLKQNDKLSNVSRESAKIVRGIDGIVTISILNPNPFFYNYEIKTEDVDIVDDYSDQFADLVNLITSLPDVSDHFKSDGARLAPAVSSFGRYRDALGILDAEIKSTKRSIQKSDRPEPVEEALNRSINSSGFGFRAAIDAIQKQPLDKGHFNSPTLEKDLNDMLETAITDGTFNSSLSLGDVGTNPTLEGLFKQAFQHLNNNLATIVNEILQVSKKDRILRF